MDHAFARSLRLGIGITVLGIGFGCGGSERGTDAVDEVDRGAPCEGMCLGKLVLKPDALFLSMSVDRIRRRLYGDGIRVDVSNPRTMKTTALPKTGPIVVDPSGGRYATTSSPGYGDDTHTLFVYEPNDSLWDSKPLPGLAFGMDADASDGRFFVTTRESDQVVVYRAASREVLANRPVGASSMNPIFNPSSGEVFVNQAVGPSSYYQWLTLDQNFEVGPSSDGHVLAVDGTRDLVYLAVRTADGSPDSRLEVRTRATWELAPTQIDTDAYWVAPDPVLDRLYVERLHDVAVFDRSSGAYLASLPFSDGFLLGNIAFAPGDDRIYVMGFEPLPAGASSAHQSCLLIFATQ